ncbi:MFS transporter [Salinispora arenicola]|uniref:MFS transporter n=1 Tax=Salinispora arenicola TaxID=168697 RepID=UPI003137ED91
MISDTTPLRGGPHPGPIASPDRRVRSLAAALYGYAFLRDLVLLYPVYPLLFTDTGLTVWQISTLFVIWSASSIVLEVPSGALADAVSRRLLLCLAPLVTAAGFALWTLVPSYPAFAVGFLLWGVGGALASGALEALVYTGLERLGAASRYARVIGRARTAETLGVLASLVLAAPVLALGGYPALGVASVLACLGGRRRRHPPTGAPRAGPPGPGADPADGEHGWWVSPAGAGWPRRTPTGRCARRCCWSPSSPPDGGALDEYLPLLARDVGASGPAVPLLLVLTWVGVAVGGLLAPAGERLGRRGYAGLIGGSAGALAAGALIGHPVGFLLVGVAFCGFQLATVLADVRLQARIVGPARATVTSLAGMATDTTIIACYVGYGLLATVAGNRVAFAVAVAPYLVVALLVAVVRPVRR